MKKTNFNKTWLAILAALLTIGFYSCGDNGTVVNDDTTEQFGASYTSDEYNPPDMASEVSDFDGGTITEEFSLPVDDNYCAQMLRKSEGEKPMEKNRRWVRKNDMRFFKLGEIFGQLQLTDEQKATVKEYLADFFRCRQALYEASLPERQEIIDDANAQRREILQQLKDGDIDRDSAQTALKSLNETTRSLLAALFDQEAYCECVQSFFDSLRATLTEEQAVTWDEWVAALEGPCFTE